MATATSTSHRHVGYAYLALQLDTGAFEHPRPAKVYPVQKVVKLPNMLQVPEQVAPPVGASALEHLLFALKHEDLDLLAASWRLRRSMLSPW